MKSSRQTNQQRKLVALNPILIAVAMFCLFHYVNCRWCTRIESYDVVRSVVTPSKCNQSYEDACGWFTSKQCIKYEIVDCLLEKNHSVVKYKMVTECCKGFKLDPINNVTCISEYVAPWKVAPSTQPLDPKKGENGNRQLIKLKTAKIPMTPRPKTSRPPTVDVKPLRPDPPKIRQPDAPKHRSEINEDKGISYVEEHIQQQHQEDDNTTLLNLSSGAYTGIICAFVFILCVVILIGLHVLKKQRRLKAKEKEMHRDFEMEATAAQKMLTFSPRA